MIENNDIGGQTANMIWHDFEYDQIINLDKKAIGVRSTRKSKLAANMLLKRYVESGWLNIQNEETIKQLSMYEEVTPNVYKAPGNAHDDEVTSMLWALYFATTMYYDAKDLGIREIDRRYQISKKDEEYKDAGVVVFNDDKEVDEDGFEWNMQ